MSPHQTFLLLSCSLVLLLGLGSCLLGLSGLLGSGLLGLSGLLGSGLLRGSLLGSGLLGLSGLLGGSLLRSSLLGSGLLGLGFLLGGSTLLDLGLLRGNRALKEVSDAANDLGSAATRAEVEQSAYVAQDGVRTSVDTLLKLCTVELGIVLDTTELAEVRLDAHTLGGHAEGKVVEGHQGGIVGLPLGELLIDGRDSAESDTAALRNNELTGDLGGQGNAEARGGLPLTLGVGNRHNTLILHFLNILGHSLCLCSLL